jgi:uncharacterized protein
MTRSSLIDIPPEVEGYLPLAAVLCMAVLPVDQLWRLVCPGLPAMLSHIWGLSATVAYGAADILGSAVSTMLLVGLVGWWDERSWRSLGLKTPSALDVGIVLAAVIISLRVSGMVARWAETTQVRHDVQHVGGVGNPLLVIPWGLSVAYVTSDAVFEELGSRAYLIERFDSLTGSIWLAGSVSLLVSILGHVFAWGVGGALERAPQLLLLVTLYMLRRNLLVCVLTHILIDLRIFILVMPWGLQRWALYIGGFTRHL